MAYTRLALAFMYGAPNDRRFGLTKKPKPHHIQKPSKIPWNFFYRPCVLSNIQLELGCPAATSSVISLSHFSSFCLTYTRKVWAGTCDVMHSLSGATGIWDHSTQCVSVTFLLNSVSIYSIHLTLTVPLRTT